MRDAYYNSSRALEENLDFEDWKQLRRDEDSDADKIDDDVDKSVDNDVDSDEDDEDDVDDDGNDVRELQVRGDERDTDVNMGMYKIEIPTFKPPQKQPSISAYV